MSEKRLTKTKMLRIRLTEHEHSKLEAYAVGHGTTVSQVMREYIRRLPNLKPVEEAEGAKHMNDCSDIHS